MIRSEGDWKADRLERGIRNILEWSRADVPPQITSSASSILEEVEDRLERLLKGEEVVNEYDRGEVRT